MEKTSGPHLQTRSDAFGLFGEAFGGEPRQYFHALVNADEHLESVAMAEVLVRRSQELVSDLTPELSFDPTTLDSSLDQAKVLEGWLSEFDTDIPDLPPVDSPLDRRGEAHLLIQLAPAALIDGCWLQHAGRVATAHLPVFASLTHRFAGKLVGSVGSHPFREILRGAHIDLPDVRSPAFAERRDILEFAFELPLLFLGYSQFPRTYLPELLGLDLACRHAAPLLVGPTVSEWLPEPRSSTEFFARASSRAPRDQRPHALQTVMDLLRGTDRERREEAWLRIRKGLAMGLRSRDRWCRSLRASLAGLKVTAHQAMIDLLRRKAPFAHGYHKELLLGERRIDDWLDPRKLNPESLLAALAESQWVQPGDAEGSPLLRDLTVFGGSMFGVFSDEELNVISSWIESLGGSESEAREPRTLSTPEVVDDGKQEDEPEPHSVRRGVSRRRSLTPRELYFHLLNVEQFPESLAVAADFADRWLDNVSEGRPSPEQTLPFRPYTRQALEGWVADRHRAQVDSYRPLTGAPRQSREELIESCIQLTPTVLVDGAWLQGMMGTCCAHTPVGRALLQIFYDEIGNGDPRRNHANIYRQLLAEMEVELPPFDSIAFVEWQGFEDSSFQIPTLWLSLSQFSRRFLPEILGLNLAVELAGVGGSYRSASDALRYYGFDSSFVDLHTIVDNPSTGHTAVAVEAIHLHLEAVFAELGERELDRHWIRVWTGFLSQGHRSSSSFSHLRRRFRGVFSWGSSS